jgi:DDE superfamily endonuclease
VVGTVVGQPSGRDGDRRVDLRSDGTAAAKKNALKPWQKRSWCIPKVSGAFVARREDVLELYAQPLDETRPVVCLDELSEEVHGQVAEPVPPPPGQPAKEDYEYKRNGTAKVFLLLCPLLGWRHLEVTARRGYHEFAQVLKALVDVSFPKADLIRVVLDNLNTPVFGALYETFPAEEARRLAQRLEFHDTPKHGSWLNLAEREFSVLTRQCLNRRLETAEQLAAEIAAWEGRRNEAWTTIDWTFRVADARKKLHWIYPS